MQTIECFNFHTDIFLLNKINNEFLGVATKKNNIKIFSLSSCKTIQNLSFELLGKETTAVAFHPTLELMAIANGKILYIVNTTQRRIVETIITEDGDISILSFLPSSPYLISGTKHGRVIQYRYKGKVHLSRLCSFPNAQLKYKKSIQNNYVSAIAHNNSYIASSGYGGTVTLIKFNSHSKKISFNTVSTRINAIAFLENQKILFANVEGTLFLSKIRKNAKMQQIQTSLKNITQILPLLHSHYALIVTQSSSIALFHTKTNKIIKRNFLHFEKEIRFVLLKNNEELFLSFNDNSIKKILLGSQQQLAEYIKLKELLKAFKLIEANPMLEDTIEALKAKNIYTTLYTKTLMQLIATNNKNILNILEPFTILYSKQNDIKELLLAYNNYNKLHSFYNDHKYTLAYALCEKFPVLKLTVLYYKMEEQYKKSFILAQKKLLSNNTNSAKELLSPYLTVSSKRAMIQLLLRQNREFLSFIKAISDKDYNKINKLVKTNVNFEEIPSYISLKKEITLQLEILKAKIDNAKIPEALKFIKQLENISIIKKDLQQLYNLAHKAKKLLYYYETDNFIKCYETIDSNIELESMQLVTLLEKHWNKLIEECEVLALEGNIHAIQEILGELIYIKTRREKIGDLLRVSFHTKIKKELYEQNYTSAENFIYSYIDIFGIDSEITQIMKKFENSSYKKLAITLIQKKHKERNAWIYSDII